MVRSDFGWFRRVNTWLGGRVGGLVAIAGLPSALLAGCAFTPQPLFGAPLAAGQVAPGLAWGTGYAPSETRVRDASGQAHHVRGNGASALGFGPVQIATVIPLLVAVRAAPLPRLELGAHAGFYGAGGGARVRLTDPESPSALFLTADGQLGYALAPPERTRHVPLPFTGRALAEGALAVAPRWHLLGAAGVSAGTRRYGVDLASFIPFLGIDEPPLGADNTLLVERTELRLETGVGGSLSGRRGGFQVLIQPWILLAHGGATAECLKCRETVTLEAIRSSWGLSVLVNPFGLINTGHRPED